MKSIEVELRSVIDRARFESLLAFFEKAGELKSSGWELTCYFDGPGDLRTRRTETCSKIIYKKGALFDEQREELEVESPSEDFEKLNAFLEALGRKVNIKWLRHRRVFAWQGVSAMLDLTRGYGCVVELEKLCRPEEKDAALELLGERMKALGLKATDKPELERRHEEYKKHWRKYLENLD